MPHGNGKSLYAELSPCIFFLASITSIRHKYLGRSLSVLAARFGLPTCFGEHIHPMRAKIH